MVTFGDGVTKIQKILRSLCLNFTRQDGQDRKKRKENQATKVTKIPKNQKTQIWDEQNIHTKAGFTALQPTHTRGP